MALLVEMDRAHERLSGPATRRILEREWREFGRPAFERLAGISASHVYNLRRSASYRKRAVEFRTTRTQDNALVEGKNGAIVRQYIGHGHIRSVDADKLRRFYARIWTRA